MTRTVTCTTPECLNKGEAIEMPDDGTAVVCGPCGAVLAEQAEGYEPPAAPSPDPATVALAIAAMSPEERAALSALLAPGPASGGTEGEGWGEVE